MTWVFPGCLLLFAACGDALPSAGDLYGSWTTGIVGPVTWEVTFAAQDDGTHAELEGLSDVYLWSGYPTDVGGGFVQTGTYRVEGALLTRTLRADDGPFPAGTELSNEIVGWTGDRLVVAHGSGDLAFRRE